MEGFRETAWLAELGCDGHSKHSPGLAGAAVLLCWGWIAGGNCRVTPGSRASTGCGVSPTAPSASRQRGQGPLTFVPARPTLSARFDVALHTNTPRLARTRSFQLLGEEN